MAPSIQFRMPPGWFFNFPPDNAPLALPPPTDARTFAAPFPIPTDIYTAALDYKVPVTIAALYATTVIAWNQINRRRGFKPYGFSQTASFKAFVILHNVFLAVFSAFTFFGMLRALAHTWPGREHHLLGKFWPGLRTANGVAGAADALCKMHGPRGFGQFVTFDRYTDAWVAHRPKTVSLGADGLPDGADVGRLWNEGLAFWGWWFYLSKFYEVFDTFIILAKGKRSSTLQTYHHTGAMMCMWAGIRYMSPPIWMFCFLNSGIHTMMYIYYTLSALSIRVPQRVKRTLTTCQILQFLIGITFAAMHLFVTYSVPQTTTAAVTQTLESIASSAVSRASSVAASATSAGIAAWLKQAALRAAGEEGLAENVLRQPVPSAAGTTQQHTRYVSGWETVPCIDTSGQAFAVWLNLLYLAPLTGLFVRFFVKSYTRRGLASRNQPPKGRANKAMHDAAKGTGREIDSLGKSAEDDADDISRHMNGNGNGKLANGNGKAHHGNGNANGTPRSRKISDSINKQWERFEKGGDESPEAVPREKGKTLRKRASEGHSKLRSMFEDGSVNERAKSPSAEARDLSEEVEHALEEKAEEKAEETVGVSPAPTQISESKEHEGLEQSEPEEEEKHEQQQEEDEEEEADDRSSTPTTLHPTRSLSPQKSRLPRPMSRDPPRSRSPAKKAPKSSSIPRPATYGTKPPLLQQRSSSSSSATSTPTTSSSPSGGVKPSAPQPAEPDAKPDGVAEDEQSSTNEVREQGRADSSSTTSATQETTSGADADSLRWRHASEAELGGGEAIRKEGVSFAKAVKEGGDDGPEDTSERTSGEVEPGDTGTD